MKQDLGRVWVISDLQAAATGFLPVLDELHSRGFDPKAKDFSGRSVAQDAAEFGHVEVLMLSKKQQKRTKIQGASGKCFCFFRRV